jgi:prolyl-tRNA synthetase
MKLSKLFTKTIKEYPAEETSINAKFLIKGGFIAKVMAGVYNYLPLGLRVLDKVNKIIREEMNATGAEELWMSVLQNKDTWVASGRWESAKEVMYQFKDTTGKEVGLGWTHEEPLAEVAKHFISSYRDLPKAVYQIQTKFRNEARAKSGLLRGREFLMKDLYSFHTDEADLDKYYERVAQAYLNIFNRCGVGALRTLASGGLFSKYSDEFQVLSPAGEDTIFVCPECAYSANIDVADTIENKICSKCGTKLDEEKSIEVGNIFKLGTKYSVAFNLNYTDEKGEQRPVIMASYGIGPGRLMATAVEVSHDEKGIIWPESIAPFKVHLISLSSNAEAEKIYSDLISGGTEVLYDDREDKTAGEKFADADLIGCPIRLVISEKTLDKDSVELKYRKSDEMELIEIKNLIKKLKPE